MMKKKHMQDQNVRVEDNRVILFDSMQPILDGNPLQSTNSIFKQKSGLVNEKQMKKIK